MTTLRLSDIPSPAVGVSARPSAQAWRRASGLICLMLCPVALAAFVSIRYGLSPLVELRAGAALYALCLIPGHLIQRHLFGIRAKTPFEGFSSALVLGTMLSPALWYLSACAGLSAAFYGVAFGLGVLVPFQRLFLRQGKQDKVRQSSQGSGNLHEWIRPAELLLVCMATALALLWSARLDWVAFEGDHVVVVPHNDHMIHTAMIGEMARAIPVTTLPFLASAHKWAYHNMPDVWCEMIRRVAGCDPREAYFFLAMPLRYVLLCAACYLGLVRRFGSAAAIVGAGCVVGFAGYPGNDWFGTYPYLHWNFPASFGLSGVFLLLYYASMIDRTRSRGLLLLMSILSVLLFWHKANFAMAVTPAVTFFCAIALMKQRDLWWLPVCLTAQVLLLALRCLDLSTADLRAPLSFEPFRFIQYAWWQGTLWLKDLDGSSWIAPAAPVLRAIRRNVDSLPGLLKWPAAFAICMLFLFHWGVPTAIYARVRLGVGRVRSGASGFDILLALCVGLCLVGFILFPVHRGLVWNVSKHILVMVSALLLALMGPVLCDIVQWARRRGRVVLGAVLCLAGVAFCANARALYSRATGDPSDTHDVISRDQYVCYRYIERHTPEDAVILHSRFEEGLLSGCLLTQRRIVLEWAPVWGTCHNVRPIVSELKAFYAGTPRDVAEATLARYRVNYVVADRSMPQRAGYESLLEPIFTSGKVAVFRARARHDTALMASLGTNAPQSGLPNPTRSP